MSLTRSRHPYEFTPRPQPEPEVKQAILSSWVTHTGTRPGYPDNRHWCSTAPTAWNARFGSQSSG